MYKSKKGTVEFGLKILITIVLATLSACSGETKKIDSKGMQDVKLPPKDKIIEWPVVPDKDTPKMTVWISNDADTNEMRQLKQIGVDYVGMGGPKIPWTEECLREIMDRFESEGITIVVMMIGGMSDIVYGRDGRNEAIENIKKSLIAAGNVGLPVVEYNFYADRLMAGYYEKKGRGGAGMTAFDYNHNGADKRSSNPDLGKPQTEDMLWDNLTRFLESVIPIAEKSGVRMALHPNDPPVPVANGHDQIMRTFDDWKRLLDIVDSPSNGMTFDPGVTKEIGEDPIEVMRYLDSKDRLNHLHYRNVISEKPYLKYTEVFLDEGQINMFEVMKELFALGYNRAIWPEHPRQLDYDKEHKRGMWNSYPGGGGYAAIAYNVAYTKAMMQAILSSSLKN